LTRPRNYGLLFERRHIASRDTCLAVKHVAFADCRGRLVASGLISVPALVVRLQPAPPHGSPTIARLGCGLCGCEVCGSCCMGSGYVEKISRVMRELVYLESATCDRLLGMFKGRVSESVDCRNGSSVCVRVERYVVCMAGQAQREPCSSMGMPCLSCCVDGASRCVVGVVQSEPMRRRIVLGSAHRLVCGVHLESLLSRWLG